MQEQFIGIPNYKFYLNTGTLNATLTTSPYHYLYSYLQMYMFFLSYNGSFYNISVTGNGFIRPVISLSANVLYFFGNGTESSPYVITLPSTEMSSDNEKNNLVSFLNVNNLKISNMFDNIFIDATLLDKLLYCLYVFVSKEII